MNDCVDNIIGVHPFFALEDANGVASKAGIGRGDH